MMHDEDADTITKCLTCGEVECVIDVVSVISWRGMRQLSEVNTSY